MKTTRIRDSAAGLARAEGLDHQVARRGHPIAFAAAHQWVQRLDATQHAGQLGAELHRLRRASR